MLNTPQYSFLYLFIRHQNLFATATHFSIISYPASTKVTSKTSLVESF